MNKLIYIILFILTSRIGGAQNLVPNGDFEQYSGCPVGYDDLDSSLYWFNPTVGGNNGSPEYFNICSPTSGLQTPGNFYGYQPAHSGVAYSGIAIYIATLQNFREYIEVPLTAPLTANECYHFEMYANLGNVCKYTSDAISVYFSDTAIIGVPNYFPLPFNPQINNLIGNVFDTLSWTNISGDYDAIGGETFLIIGNFRDDAATTAIVANNSGLQYAYCYIDDISLTTCTTGLNEMALIPNTLIYPNPFNGKLNVQANDNQIYEIIIYDISSRKLLQKQFTNSLLLNTEQLAKGIYIYEVKGNNGSSRKGTIVKD